MRSAFLITYLLVLAAATALADDTPAALFLSTDRGTSWQPFTDGLPDSATVRETFEHRGKTYLVTNHRGLYVMEKEDCYWQRIDEGLPDGIFATAVAYRDDLIVLGTFHDGIFVSTDGGIRWRRPLLNIPGNSVRALRFHEGVLYAGTHVGYFRSYDNGRTWQRGSEETELINEITVHGGRVYFARQNGMGVLNGNEIEWAEVKTEWAITQLYAREDHLYAVSAMQEIIRTRDGSCWETPPFAPGGTRTDNPAEALWHGTQPQLPGGLPVGRIDLTSRGWLASPRRGC